MSTGKAFDRKLVSDDIIFFCLIPCVSWLFWVSNTKGLLLQICWTSNIFCCSDCKFLNWFWMPTWLNNLKDKFLVVVKFCWSVLGSEWLQVVEPLGLFCVWINIFSFSMKPNMIIYNLIFWHGLKMEQGHEVYLLFWSNSQFSCRTLFSYEKI